MVGDATQGFNVAIALLNDPHLTPDMIASIRAALPSDDDRTAFDLALAHAPDVAGDDGAAATAASYLASVNPAVRGLTGTNAARVLGVLDALDGNPPIKAPTKFATAPKPAIFKPPPPAARKVLAAPPRFPFPSRVTAATTAAPSTSSASSGGSGVAIVAVAALALLLARR